MMSLVSVVPDAVAPITFSDNPVADPKAVVERGDVRFTILTPQMIRMEWSPGRRFEDHASLVFVNRRLPVPKYEVRSEQRWTVIDTGHLVLRYKDGTGKFTAENLSIALTLNGKAVTWKPGTPDVGNLCGTTRTLDRVNGSKVGLEPGLLSRDGWTVVDDTDRPLLDNSEWPWVMPRTTSLHQDLYFFGYGHDYRQALADYTQVAGKIPLPPRFVFGSWWSRYWPYTDQELIELVDEFKAHDVPLDVLVIDMDWHLTFHNAWARNELDDAGQRKGWTGYTWDPLYFPAPEKFLDWVHGEGLKATINMHPASGVQPHEDAYCAFARAMDIDPATKRYVPFDIANKKFAENYFKLLHHPLEEQGVDFFWLDWQQEEHTSVAGLNPTFWLNYTHFTDMEREGKRPLLYHRWGGLGNHRYQIGFSGDTISSWATLAFQPYFTATAGNVGYGYWSHDIGGHQYGKVEAELYTRWVQFGAFSPMLRTHTTKNPDAERRIWAYPLPYAEAMREAFVLRYALIPYIYTAAREAYNTGISIMRPMYYECPEEPEAYEATDQYLFGDDILVAPVVTAMDPVYGLSRRSVWLPEGEWIEWFSGAHLEGLGRIERTFALDEIPVYVRAGAIIPMQPKMGRSGDKPIDPLILKVFPGASGSTSVYEDDGNSLGYKHDECAWTKVSCVSCGRETRIEIAPVQGRYPGMLEERGYQIELVQTFPTEEVVVNGEAVPYGLRLPEGPCWWYDGARLTTVIRLPRFDVQKAVNVTVRVGAEEAASAGLLRNAAGRFARLRRAMDIINADAHPEWSPDTLISAVQTSRRIELNPASALDELRAFWAAQDKVLAEIESISTHGSVIDRALGQITNDMRQRQSASAAG